MYKHIDTYNARLPCSFWKIRREGCLEIHVYKWLDRFGVAGCGVIAEHVSGDFCACRIGCFCRVFINYCF